MASKFHWFLVPLVGLISVCLWVLQENQVQTSSKHLPDSDASSHLPEEKSATPERVGEGKSSGESALPLKWCYESEVQKLATF